MHVLELYNQVRESSYLFCVARSILKRVFTTFRTNFRSGASPFLFPFRMLPPENVIPERVHSGFCTVAGISFWCMCESSRVNNP